MDSRPLSAPLWEPDMPVILYGIPNCDTVRKARAWLESRSVPYTFHDYKRSGCDPARLVAWGREVGWEALLNRAGTTFRRLAEAERAGLNEEGAVRLMLSHPSMIRRPVLETRGGVLVGFSEERYQAALDAGHLCE